MKKLLLLLFLPLFAAAASAQGFDSNSSHIAFEVNNWLVNTVKGTIRGWEGKVSFDPENPRSASFDIRAKVKTIDTDNDERDEHLLTSDFFDAEKYPVIRFESIRVNALPEGGFIAVGNLTIRDVTKEVLMPFEHREGKLMGEMSINRLEYNVGEDQSTFSVGKEVNIAVVCDLK